MHNTDRRSYQRHPLAVPVRFCQGGAAFGTEVNTRSVNISQSGLLITSPVPLAVGSTVLMSIKVPTEISGSAFNELQCLGRIVHESHISDSLGYGIQLAKMCRDWGAGIEPFPRTREPFGVHP